MAVVACASMAGERPAELVPVAVDVGSIAGSEPC
jgi:hypothetical protein